MFVLPENTLFFYELFKIPVGNSLTQYEIKTVCKSLGSIYEALVSTELAYKWNFCVCFVHVEFCYFQFSIISPLIVCATRDCAYVAGNLRCILKRVVEVHLSG